MTKIGAIAIIAARNGIRLAGLVTVLELIPKRRAKSDGNFNKISKACHKINISLVIKKKPY